jgi:3-hydroxyisobutyrate dehydrogenase-like beta-hydroxyacid dehydrogenase
MKKLAYLGLGVMGSGMAGQLLEAGYPVTVWNRTPEKARPLVEQGATQAGTPAEAVADAEVILYCLANDDAVEDVVYGEEGILKGVHRGQIAVDMSTVYPETSRRESKAYAEKEIDFLDAPVFGSRGEAKSGGLWIVVGGERDVLESVRPILEPLSATLHYMGGTGMGTSMKLVGNLIVALQLEALGESMVLATKAGLNPTDVLDVLHVTDFRSPIFDGVGPSLVERDFSTDFALRHMLKDANLIAQLAEELRVPVPAGAVVRELLKAAVNEGWGDENASALIKELERMADTTVKD